MHKVLLHSRVQRFLLASQAHFLEFRDPDGKPRHRVNLRQRYIGAPLGSSIYASHWAWALPGSGAKPWWSTALETLDPMRAELPSSPLPQQGAWLPEKPESEFQCDFWQVT